ncbi:ribose-phosphate diphosphokinase [Candidatus Daviesbacteria bacterium]|nr:ribose-phosphate diphosphokinase [Candidatus Daviesbacteria bacterium]
MSAEAAANTPLCPHCQQCNPTEKNNFVLLTGTSNPQLAINVGKNLKQAVFSGIREPHSDGEIDPKIPISVRRKNVYIIQSTCGPNINSSILELALMIRTAQEADANEITAIIPHFAYARSDKKNESRVPIGARMIAEILELAGATRIVTMDLHNRATEATVNKARWINLFVSRLFIPVIESLAYDEVTICATDAGGLKMARWFRNALRDSGKVNVSPDVQAADKYRELGVKDKSYSSMPQADYKDRNFILVDDMLSSGGTMVSPAVDLMKMGAKSVGGIVTHALWTGKAVENVAKSPLKFLYVTDTVPQPKAALELPIVQQISIAPMLADVINCIEYGKSVDDLFMKASYQEKPISPLYDPC